MSFPPTPGRYRQITCITADATDVEKWSCRKKINCVSGRKAHGAAGQRSRWGAARAAGPAASKALLPPAGSLEG